MRRSTGTLTLSVVPGRFREAVFSDPQGRHPAIANALPIRSGGVLNLRDIEQGLENLQRVPTVSADIKIAPADGEDAAPGQSDLQIDWTQRSPVRASVTLDDAGRAYGSGGCNHWFAPYTLDGQRLTFGGVGSTRFSLRKPRSRSMAMVTPNPNRPAPATPNTP